MINKTKVVFQLDCNVGAWEWQFWAHISKNDNSLASSFTLSKVSTIILHPHVSDLLLSQPATFNKLFGNRQFDQIYCFLLSKFLSPLSPSSIYILISFFFFFFFSYFVASIFISFFYCTSFSSAFHFCLLVEVASFHCMFARTN